jgi:hypothetical protein
LIHTQSKIIFNFSIKKAIKKQVQNICEDEEVEHVDHKMLNKKTKRKQTESDEEEEVKPKAKAKKVVKKQVESDEVESDEGNAAVKPVFKAPVATNGNGVNVPFKRIDDSIKHSIKTDLKDNSYDTHMHKTGDDYGRQANDKLKFTRGGDFKKEKTKFKNKTAFGGQKLSMEVRSIKLEDDSD